MKWRRSFIEGEVLLGVIVRFAYSPGFMCSWTISIKRAWGYDFIVLYSVCLIAFQTVLFAPIVKIVIYYFVIYLSLTLGGMLASHIRFTKKTLLSDYPLSHGQHSLSTLINNFTVFFITHQRSSWTLQ